MDALEAGAKTEPRKRKRSSSSSVVKEDSPAGPPAPPIVKTEPIKTEPSVPAAVKVESQPEVSPKPEKPMFKVKRREKTLKKNTNFDHFCFSLVLSRHPGDGRR